MDRLDWTDGETDQQVSMYKGRWWLSVGSSRVIRSYQLLRPNVSRNGPTSTLLPFTLSSLQTPPEHVLSFQPHRNAMKQ